MKISGAALPLLLLLLNLVSSFALTLNDAGQGNQVQDDPDLMGPNKCCKNYTKNNIPCQVIQSYHYTDAQCPRPAIVFVMKNKKEACADPKDAWVQKCLKKLPTPDS